MRRICSECPHFRTGDACMCDPWTPKHHDYPHQPGTLYGCAACERECLCDSSSSRCVYCSTDTGRSEYI